MELASSEQKRCGDLYRQETGSDMAGQREEVVRQGIDRISALFLSEDLEMLEVTVAVSLLL